ncbi:Fucose permease [Devosia enhydra]|uniref:Fucose permease n=1 Tax=Devosia enhydra TaxID=665118 RepID=A0A1K2HYD2_9HYPH|nr:MFS transporter [Devosia enhydra]SFZ84866.1 Fucose permease [Devosia enhydra]
MRFGLSLPPQMRVYGAFFMYSFCMGSLFPRLPELKAQMGASESELGLALIGTAAGTLVSLTFGGPLLDRIGYRRAILGMIPLLSLGYALATFAPGPLAFFLLLLPVGLLIGAIEIIVNLEADRVEHQIGRRIMNRSHAFWSFGFFSSGLVGATVAQAGISPQTQMLAMVPVIALGVAVILGRFDPAPHRSGGSTEAGPRFAAPSLPILVLVVVTLSAMILEGAGIDWSAIYMTNEFSAAPFIAGIAVATGAGAQAVTRFFVDGFVEKFSPAGVARTLLTILGLGTLIVFFAPHPGIALLGFALLGVGSSAIFPLAMSAAAQRTDRPAAVNVAALAQISFVAFLVGPPLLGFVAEHFGIRWSFGIGLPLVVLSFISAGALGRRTARPALP